MDGYSVEVIRDLFPAESNFILYFAEKNKNGYFRQHTIRLENLKDVLYVYDAKEDKDVYLSKNLFNEDGHSEQNLKVLTTIVIDIDCHNENIKTQERNQLLEELEKEIDVQLEHKRMYDVLVCSGRGLHYYFHFKAEEYNIDSSHLYKTAVESIILNLEKVVCNFEGLEIDKSCSVNASGFVRLPSTFNIEAMEYSKIKSYHKLKEIPLKELCSIFIDVKDDSTLNAILLSKKQSRNRRIPQLKIESDFNTKTMLNRRLLFLKKIQDIRKFEVDPYQNRINNEMREVTLLLYYSTAYALLQNSEAVELTERFNKGFNRPLSPGRFNQVIKAIDVQIIRDEKARWFTNQTFIKLLAFNSYEEEQARIHFYLLYRENSEKKAEAKKVKENDIQKRNTEILYLYKHGKTQLEIAKQLKCSIKEVNVQLKEVELSKSEQTLIEVQKCKRKGLTQAQTSKKLAVSLRTVKNYWNS